jgi:S1-C subfamily serine protease
MIFISYRREDSAYTADRIFDQLQRRYGKHAVFMDVDSIRAGKDFRQVLREYLYKSDVLLAVIGKLWIAVKDESGQRRLDRADDYVREEILTAMERGIPVIPLVIDGAQMPTSLELPAALKDLAYRNAHKIRPNRDFEPDMELLIETLRKDWCVKPDPWWRFLIRRPAGSKVKPNAVETPSAAPAPASPGRPALPAVDTGRVEGKSSLEESLVERVRRIQRSRTHDSGESSTFNPQKLLSKCYIRSGSRITGPFNEIQLRLMRGRGEISPIHEISTDRVHWSSAAALVGILDQAKPATGAARPPAGFWAEAEKNPTPEIPIAPKRVEPVIESPQWYYADSGREQVGPISEEDLIDLLARKRLSRKTLVCKAGETRWECVGRHPALAAFAPPASGRLIAIIGCSVLALIAIGIIFVFAALGSRSKLPPAKPDTSSLSSAPSRTGAILSVSDEPNLKQAVGLVVCGWTLHLNNGDMQDDAENTGTCFAVSSRGHLITNKHVVQDVKKRQRMTREYVLRDYACSRVRSDALDAIRQGISKGTVKSPSDDDESEKLIVAVSEKLAEPLIPKLRAVVSSIEPKVWVFMGSRNAVHVAEVILVSDHHDLAVLKINVAGMPYLRMAKQSDLPHPPTHVFALGFPGTSREAASREERGLQVSKEHRMIASLFRDRDFIYDVTEGAVSKIFTEDGGGRQWIQHKADINPGNSGGPLVTSDCVVVAVNTQYSKRARDASATLRSLATPQLLQEISPLLDSGEGQR